jgi:ribonuclease P protein component
LLFYKKTSIRQFTLHKNERLKKRKEIESLFRQGKSFVHHPFRVYFEILNNEEAKQPLLFGVGVSKKFFKKAVSRNRIKRLVREAYRLQKNNLKTVLQNQQLSAKLFFIYTGDVIPNYALVLEKLGAILQKLEKDVLKNEKNK